MERRRNMATFKALLDAGDLINEDPPYTPQGPQDVPLPYGQDVP